MCGTCGPRRPYDTRPFLVSAHVRRQLEKLSHLPSVKLTCMQFAEAFEREFGGHSPNILPQRSGEFSRDTMHRTALATFEKKTSKTHDWFDASRPE